MIPAPANEYTLPRRVLFAFDGSEGSHAALEDLRHAGLPTKMEALVVTCADLPVNPPFYEVMPVEGGGVVTMSSIEAARKVVEREMRRAASVASGGADVVRRIFGDWTVRSELAVGTPYWQVIEKAKEWSADLIVIGSHSRSALGRFLFGSIAQNVLAHAPCAVRIGRHRTGHESAAKATRILLGVDGSADAIAAVDAIAARRWEPGTEVRVVCAVDLRLPMDLTLFLATEGESDRISPMQDLLKSVSDRLRDSKLLVTTLLVDGDPKSALVDEAKEWGADCIFLGAKGHSRLERFLIGSVSASVAARAGCSVEVVRPSRSPPVL